MIADGRTGKAAKDKRRLRFQLRANRASRPLPEREQARDALTERVLQLPELSSPTTVACYASTPEEPGTADLLDELSASGHTVLLPVLEGNRTLDWAVYEPGAMQPGTLGIDEPTGARLGVEAIAAASVVVCPGLAADEGGGRLGRGGGSYDRVLSGVSDETLRVILLYDDEVLPAVPTDESDEPIHVIVTPTRTLRTSSPPA